MTEREAWVALNMIPKLGPVRLRALLARFGTPEAVLSASRRELLAVEGIGEEVAASLASWQSLADPAAEIEKARALGARILTQADAEYPPLLREIHDPPTVLYIWGDLRSADRFAVAVVGTRKPSSYGLECAKKLSFQLAFAGAAIVSGLARGVDAAAHQAALAAKGRTVAVIGSALDRLYPPEHRELAERIASAGAVVSEFPLGTVADRQTFPMRNRIISGMAAAVLVVEAGLKSGALITASQAAEQGRCVYAVPGPITVALSAGCNRLIQQGAKLVTDARDILDELGLAFAQPPSAPRPQPPQGLSEPETKVFEALREGEAGVDELVVRTGLPAATVSSSVLSLELRGLLKACPGSRFTLTL